jgi:hypothetical protein
LVPGKIFLLGLEITKVDWAEPEFDGDERTKAVVAIWISLVHSASPRRG